MGGGLKDGLFSLCVLGGAAAKERRGGSMSFLNIENVAK